MKATRGQADASVVQTARARLTRRRRLNGPRTLLSGALGIVLIIVGYTRARGPWSRYQALRDQQANIDRTRRGAAASVRR